MIKNILILTIIAFFVSSIYPQNRSFDPQLEILKWKYGYKSAFSFTFDDGLHTQYEYAKPVLEQYDFRGTFYVLPPFLAVPPIWRYGTWQMFQSMSWDNHEIGSHTLNHPHLTSLSAGDTLTQNTIHYELYHSQRQIELKTGKTTISLAYPYSDHNSFVDSLTSIYYESGRSVGPLPNASTPGNQFGLSSYPVTFSLPRNSASDDLDELNNFMEWTENSIEDSLWGIIMIHEVVPFEQIGDLINQGLYEPMSTEWLSLFCSWLQTKSNHSEVWVQTVDNVTRYIKERDNTSYEIVSVTDDQMNFRMSNNLNSSIYNFPLTALVSVPGDWIDAYITQGNYSDSLLIYNSHLGRTVMVNVVPDRSIFTISKNKLTDTPNSVPIVSSFTLEQNYPNPFNPITKIKYTVGDAYYASPARVMLQVYDVLGNEIATLVDECQPTGTYEVEFSVIGGTASGNTSGLSSGIYFYRLQSGSFIETKKMLILK